MPRGLCRQLLLEQLAVELGVDVQMLEEQAATHGLQSPLPIPRLTKQQRITLRHPWPPAYLALSILLQQPALRGHISDDLDLCGMITLPGSVLLTKIVALLKRRPEIQVGGILALCQDPEEHRLISVLAAHPLPLSDEQDLVKELDATFVRLRKQMAAHQADALIQKAKIDPLSLEEQQKLQMLLTKAHTDLI